MDIEQLINTYSSDLYRIAYIYTKDLQAAEEVVQDVFFTFYRTQQFDGRSSVKTYLTRMTIHRSYDYLRSWKNKKNVWLEAFTTSSKGADQTVLQQEERLEIVQVVLQLPVKYREVIILYYYEDLQLADIAELLQIPLSTAKSRLQRAREKLKKVMPERQWEVLKDA